MGKISRGYRVTQWIKDHHRAGIAAVGVTGVVIVLRLMGLLQTVELAAFDQLFRWRPPEPPDDRIVIAEINETNLQELKKWPISDQEMAQLLQKLKTYHPKAIGLDLYRNFPVEPGYAEFVKTAETFPNLIGIQRLKDEKSLGVPPPSVLAKTGQIGFNNIAVDGDGKVRRSLLYWHVHGERHTSFALKLALIYLKDLGITPQASVLNSNYLQLGKAVFPYFKSSDGGYIGADDSGYQIIAHFRPPGSFRIVPITDILSNRVPPESLRDRIILIGSKASSVEDVFYTPYSQSNQGTLQETFGVELQANFISQILSATLDERPLIKVWSDVEEGLWIFLWSSIGAFMIWQLRSLQRGLMGILIASVSLIVICYVAFLLSWWLPLVPSLLALMGAAIVAITHVAYLKEELKRSKDFLQTVIHFIPDPVFVKDKNHRWIILNHAYCQFVGYPLHLLIEKSDYDIFPPHQADTFWHHDELVFQTGESQENEEELTDAFGNTHLVATKKSLHKDAAGNIFLVGVIRDITERKRTENELRQSNSELRLSQNQLRYLAYHDSLTGLANRKQFHERLSQSLEWAKTEDKLVALMFLDLDGFKQVNDTLGHDIGDLLLKDVAQRLIDNLRHIDIVSRLGGDEFTIILPGIGDVDEVSQVAKKIAQSVSQVFVLEGHNVFVTTSIGISIYPLDSQEEETLIKNADTAMYRAKKLGRNQHQFCHY